MSSDGRTLRVTRAAPHGPAVVRARFAGRLALLVGAAFLVGGCATLDGPRGVEPPDPFAPRIAAFSEQTPGGKLPSGWQPWHLAKFKRETAYRLVDADGRTVVRAHAESSASGLIYRVRFDPRDYPVIRWRWKVPALIEGADNSARNAEDSPVRIVVAFDGDPAKLPIMDRVALNQFRMLTKQTLPYATLMYIWENRATPGTVIENGHTSRIRMIVADSGETNVGEWRSEERNLVADYRKAFGEDPPPVKWIGILTDTDNTRKTAAGYYGDIRISAK
jgi:hypothetical protein